MENAVVQQRRSLLSWRLSPTKIRVIGWAILRALILLGICYVILFPLLAKLSSSLMTRADLWDQTVHWIPRHPTLGNFRAAWAGLRYPEAFLNSLQLALMTSVLQLASCTVVGYGFARFDYPETKIAFVMVLLTLIVPPSMLMIPLYLNFRFFNIYGLLPDGGLNLIGTFWPFILTSITGNGLRNGLFIYIMRQFFKGMPRDLEEAAYVDGAGPFKTFFRVMLPHATPALVTIFLFAFVWQWNEDFFVTIYMGGQTILPVTLANLPETILGSHYSSALAETSLVNNTGSLLFIAPLLLLYAFMQRYFIESVERTGLIG